MKLIFLETELLLWLMVDSAVLDLRSSSRAGRCGRVVMLLGNTMSPCRYGVGYHMTLVKEPNCVSENVERLVCSFVPEAKQETDVGAELSFTLPSNATSQFPELFDKLDSMWFFQGILWVEGGKVASLLEG